MYDVAIIDLSVVGDKQLVPRGTPVAEMFLLDIVDGAKFQLSIGNSPFFTVTKPFAMEPTSRMRSDGLRSRVLAAQVGVSAELVIVYADTDGAELNTVLG